MKIAVLSNNTMRGLEWDEHEWYFSEYSKLDADVLNKDSDLYQFNPDIILVSILPINLGQIGQTVSALTFRCDATILVHNSIELLDRPIRFLQKRHTLHHNFERACIPADEHGVFSNRIHVLDLESLALRHGRDALIDPRFYFLAKRPFGDFGMKLVREQLRQAIEVLTTKRKKCLVVDLDNTLWGGLLADEITLSQDGVGRAFYEFQKSIKVLADSGVILAICSKNDEQQALDVINNHPDMALRIEDFAAWRINWKDKPSNIIEIAEELNIGLDSIVFIDDSLHEVSAVASVAGVTAAKVPDEPETLCRWLADQLWFETFSLTETDLNRNEMYVQDRHRREAAEGMSYEDFLKSLEIKVRIERANEHTLPRVAQLSERTNQFNLNGRVFKVDEIQHAYIISYEDRFGSQGIVGAAVIEDENVAGLYMSCRILGRGVEDAFFTKLFVDPGNCGKVSMSCELKNTGKNSAAREFINKWKPGVPAWIEIESCELSLTLLA